MKAKEDLRTIAESSGDFYSEEEEDEEEDNSYDSEESSSKLSPSSSTCNNNNRSNHQLGDQNKNDNVLVLASCKSCLMYFMVPKQVEDYPKCNDLFTSIDEKAKADFAWIPFEG
ncbi:hypothetical protein Dsin_012135 [Dipteronia sinensis]|uniref:Uncharacterized protein n=1 Tax=Dipteronia sinensis TaxID=43782 RepID=A0AAE0AI41_9ROSI|nr:hypothetical protein Dsin_012135 [Dipteronia sinensis]